MIGLNKTTSLSLIIYVVIVIISLLISSSNESAAYALFFSSSVFFSSTIVYQVWRMSKFVNEIKHPTSMAVLNKVSLSEAIEKMLLEKSPSTYVINRLQGILVKKISRKYDIAEADAERLLQNPENLRELGYDELALLISKDNFWNKTKNERINLLNTILSRLEED